MKYIQNKNIGQRVMENEVMIVLPREINKNITNENSTDVLLFYVEGGLT